MAKKVLPEEVAKRIQNNEDVFIIDVRESGEIAGGKIPSANNIPLSQLALRKGELDNEKSYVVVCQSGNRSKAACGILDVLGFKVEDMTGGMNSWNGYIEKK